MPPLYLVEQGAKLSRESERLLVTRNDEVLARVPLIKVSQVLIFGAIQVTTQALRLCLKAGIEVVYMDQHGRYWGRMVGPETKTGERRRQQYERASDPAYKLALARCFVSGKLRNMRTILQRRNRNVRDPQITEAVDKLGGLVERVSRTTTLNSLRGVEGSAAALYFGVFKKLFDGNWTFKGRVRRPPTDPLNVLLSFGYTLLQHNIWSAVHTVGLDPYIGFLHEPAHGRPSLALDIMEEYRPVVVDSLVMRVCNQHLLTPGNFHKTGDPQRPILLDEAGRKRFVREFEARLDQTSLYSRPAALMDESQPEEQVTCRRSMELQVRHLAACLRTVATSYQPFTVR